MNGLFGLKCDSASPVKPVISWEEAFVFDGFQAILYRDHSCIAQSSHSHYQKASVQQLCKYRSAIKRRRSA